MTTISNSADEMRRELHSLKSLLVALVEFGPERMGTNWSRVKEVVATELYRANNALHDSEVEHGAMQRPTYVWGLDKPHGWLGDHV